MRRVTVVVTGASGHVGGNLVRALCAAAPATRVRALVFEDGRTLDGLDVERVPGDVSDVRFAPKLWHQLRPEDLARIRAACADALRTYFDRLRAP